MHSVPFDNCYQYKQEQFEGHCCTEDDFVYLLTKSFLLLRDALALLNHTFDATLARSLQHPKVQNLVHTPH